MEFSKDDVYTDEKTPYLRPCLCKGNSEGARIIVAGLTPTTRITPLDAPVEAYLEALSDYYKFIRLYESVRNKARQNSASRIRARIESLVDLIEAELKTPVIETNIYTYPAKDDKELKKLRRVKKRVIARSNSLFWRVVEASNAEIIIPLGAAAAREFELTNPGAREIKTIHMKHLCVCGDKAVRDLIERLKKSLA
ncbi:MAG: hypothetical protein LBU36_00315 [Clostridiales bacterium]|jgi:hypothetical protein|nr:hypothetical protein [Clostridiales bacterium]